VVVRQPVRLRFGSRDARRLDRAADEPYSCARWRDALRTASERERWQARAASPRGRHVFEQGGDVETAVNRRERCQPPRSLLELALAPDTLAAHALVPGHGDVHEALEEVPLGSGRSSPGLLERLVRAEEVLTAKEREAALIALFDTSLVLAPDLVHHRTCDGTLSPVATILVAGVDLFFRGKLDAALGSAHRLVTTESIDPPDLVIVDIARVDPDEVAETYPDCPILGFTNHTDTEGLRRAKAAGCDRGGVRSALAERAGEIVDELVG